MLPPSADLTLAFEMKVHQVHRFPAAVFGGLEKVCNAQLRMMAAGGRIHPVSDEVTKYTASQFDLDNTVAGKREWPAVMRQLDAVDTSYRE